MTKKQDRYITFALVLIIILLLNALLFQYSPTVDLTKDKIYSISDETKNTLKNLREPMTVKFFITPNLPPPFLTYEKYTKDLLTQYKNASRGNFNFEIIDASKNKEEAIANGVSESQINVLEKDETKIKRVFFGLSIMYGELKETLPFIQSTVGMEYYITTLMRNMINKNDRLSRLEDNLDVYLIVSSDIIPLLPEGIFEMLPITLNEAVIEANKTLMNKVTFQNVDTKASNFEELVSTLGIEKVVWESILDENGNVILEAGDGYFDLILANGDDIISLSTLSLLEGDNASIVSTIESGINDLLKITKTVGYLQGHNEIPYMVVPEQYGGTPEDYYSAASDFANAIGGNYEFLPINISEGSIPNSVDALIVAGSDTPFSEYELYEIDQFIMSGKPVLFLLNGVKLDDSPMVQAGYAMPTLIPIGNNLDNILTNYGVSIANNFILDKEAYKAQADQNSPVETLYYVPIILPENINNKNPITKGLTSLIAPFPSEVLEITNENNVKFIPLISTSKDSWSIPEGDEFALQSMNPEGKELDFKRHTIAASLEGEMTSAFIGKDIPKNEASKFESKEMIEKSPYSRIIVVGSPEMIKNPGFQANAIFAMSAVDYIAGDTGLMEIRRKGSVYNPPYNIGDFAKLVVRGLNIVFLPLAVILFGFILWNLDKKRRKNIKQKYTK